MHTVVETPGYMSDASAIFTAKEREEIVTLVASDQECGDVMQGTGGVRKVRVGRWWQRQERSWSTCGLTFTVVQTTQSFCLPPLRRTRRAT